MIDKSLFRKPSATSVWEHYVEFHARSEFKMQAIALIGAIGFPTYYVIWKYLIPQGYENAPLRIIGMFLCLGILTTRHWPQRYQTYAPGFSYIALIYCLPFFFTIMLLKSDFSVVWQLSFMSSLLFTVLVYDTLNSVVASIFGVCLGALASHLTGSAISVPPEKLYFVPIAIFTFVGIIFLSYTSRRIDAEKMNAAFALARNLAHEVRTPLMGVAMEAITLQKNMEELCQGYIWAAKNGRQSVALDKSRLALLMQCPDRIQTQADAANQVINSLLVNVRFGTVEPNAATIHSTHEIVKNALHDYPFRPGERKLISVDLTQDQFVSVDGILMKHVMYNLIKNALRAIQEKGEGGIFIGIEAEQGFSKLTITDTGVGISPNHINRIFIPFVTFSAGNVGTGVGLAFCKRVIENMGGAIEVESKQGEFTSFTIRLPAAVRATAD